jgi:hypothetical protein
MCAAFRLSLERAERWTDLPDPPPDYQPAWDDEEDDEDEDFASAHRRSSG